MEGPTPVSALIHAATMVTAGVYMVARSNALFVLAPTSMKTVAIIGALTAIFAASIGLVQNDIKRVLAYSTVSQLGYMFLALGVGAFSAGVFHVFTHAFFKALLFLGAGSVIHAMSGEQDMRNMGDLRETNSDTFWTMFIATLAIAGIPPFAGFFSKDEILWQTWISEGGAYRSGCGSIGYVTALMTAFYMFRLMYLTFYGKPRMSHEVEHHIHESPKSMTMPLMILAVLSRSSRDSWDGRTAWADRIALRHSWSRCFAREASARSRRQRPQVAAGEKEEEQQAATEYVLMFLSVAAGVVGWGMAWTRLPQRGQGIRRADRGGGSASLQRALTSITSTKVTTTRSPAARNWADVRLGAMGLGEGVSWFDSHVIDGAVNGAGWMTRTVGYAFQLVGQVDHRRRAASMVPRFWRACCRYPARLVAVGTGAVVCAGDGDGLGWVCSVLRVAVSYAVCRASKLLDN